MRHSRIGENPQHRSVLAERVGTEGDDPAGTGQRSQMLQQQCSHTTVLHPVGDSHRDLRLTRHIGRLVLRDPDQIAAQPCAQRRVVFAVRPADPRGHLPAMARLSPKNRR